MAETMDPLLRAQLLERLSHRAERLAKCARLNAPDTVLAMMAQHVANTVVVLVGVEFQRQLMETVFSNTVESYGVCRFCGVRALRGDGTMCQVCWDQAQSDDDITEDELIAMGLDDGGCDQQ